MQPIEAAHTFRSAAEECKSALLSICGVKGTLTVVTTQHPYSTQGSMAIYHLHIKHFSRKEGHSAVAAAAYRAGDKLRDERTDVIHDYTRRHGVVHNEILAPGHAPSWATNRERLWNAVEAKEDTSTRRKTAQLAREVEVALPRELDLDTHKRIVRSFMQEKFVAHGMIADIAIHNDMSQDGDENPHAHIMLTMRDITGEGFGNKNRSWNGYVKYPLTNDVVVDWRKAWAEHVNHSLTLAGESARIDHRTLKAQGLDQEPTTHIGKEAHALEEKGTQTVRGDKSRETQHENSLQAFAQSIAPEQTQEELELVTFLVRVREQMREWFDRARDVLFGRDMEHGR